MIHAELRKMIAKLKEPVLIYHLRDEPDCSPSLDSYVGGTPYTEKHDRLPICRLCKQALTFVFQLHMPAASGSELFAFYYCFSCKPHSGSKGFLLKKYPRPSLEALRSKPAAKSSVSYAAFVFEPQWSLPDWDSLATLHPALFKALAKEFEAEAEREFERIKEDILDPISIGSFSFFGGYPNFFGFPRFPSCKHCGQTMQLWMQVDSDDEKGMIWKEHSCLQIFSCPQGAGHLKILIQ